MKKRNIKLKKPGSIKNKDREYNTWYIGRVMGMNITNGLQKHGCLMQKR